MLIEVKNLSKEYNKEKIFSDISFTVEDGHKIAFAGENGAGKSTILKIITGLEEPTTGSVVFSKNTKVGYLPQEISGDIDLPVIDYIKNSLDKELKDHLIYKFLDGLNFAKDSISNNVGSLSGGQQTKVLLTILLLGDSNVLLLDEPTNNLDIPSILWLEKYLSKTKKAIIVVSHDVYFLQNVTDRFFNLNKAEKKFIYNRGSYAEYIRQKFKEEEKKLKEFQREEKRCEEVKAQIEKYKKQTEDVKKNYKHSDNDKKAKGYPQRFIYINETLGNSRKKIRDIEKINKTI